MGRPACQSGFTPFLRPPWNPPKSHLTTTGGTRRTWENTPKARRRRQAARFRLKVMKGGTTSAALQCVFRAVCVSCQRTSSPGCRCNQSSEESPKSSDDCCCSSRSSSFSSRRSRSSSFLLAAPIVTSYPLRLRAAVGKPKAVPDTERDDTARRGASSTPSRAPKRSYLSFPFRRLGEPPNPATKRTCVSSQSRDLLLGLRSPV